MCNLYSDKGQYAETGRGDTRLKYYCKNCGAEYKTGMGGLADMFTGNEKCLCCGGRSFGNIPYHETVAQWEERKGRKYPGTAPVYNWFYIDDNHTGWNAHMHQSFGDRNAIVATEAGAPTDNWRPK
jgi:hypothetical protein